MNRRIGCIAIPLILWLMSSISAQNLSTSFAIGPSAVWNPPPGVAEKLYSACGSLWGDPQLVSCVSSFMRKNGASPQAIEFSKQLDCKGFLVSFRETGKVDIGGRLLFCSR